MSVEFWTRAERFYEFWFIIISILLLINVLAIIFVLTYASKENRKKSLIIVFGFIAVLGLTGFLGHSRYRSYLVQASYSNPLIRDREPRLGTYTYYRASEQNYYTQLNALESLRDMVLYEETQVVEPIKYLGQGEYFHYFEQLNGQPFKTSDQIEFVKETSKAQLVGSQFSLKDESFREIGFKNPGNIMFEAIKVPAHEQGKMWRPENDFKIPKMEEHFRRWNF